MHLELYGLEFYGQVWSQSSTRISLPRLSPSVHTLGVGQLISLGPFHLPHPPLPNHLWDLAHRPHPQPSVGCAGAPEPPPCERRVSSHLEQPIDRSARRREETLSISALRQVKLWGVRDGSAPPKGPPQCAAHWESRPCRLLPSPPASLPPLTGFLRSSFSTSRSHPREASAGGDLVASLPLSFPPAPSFRDSGLGFLFWKKPPPGVPINEFC